MRIEILCKKTCSTAPHFLFLSLISFEILGMIEPWPKCQPEESRLGSRLGLNLSGLWGGRLEGLSETGAESVGYIGGTTVFVSVVCICRFCLSFGEEVGDMSGEGVWAGRRMSLKF